jgi:ferredoxin
MPNVTFSSPKLKKDYTTYAKAGDRKTILGVAKDNGIEIDCECEKGECGSCVVEVIHIGNKPPMGVHVTEKEKLTLLTSGKLKKADFEELEVLDLAPRHRLACQYMLLDEDIVVKF